MSKEKKEIKLLIIGHKRHGKDTVAALFNEYFNLTFQSSSYKAAEIFIFDELREKYGYKNFVECFEDRVNHREEWYNLICDYNKFDKARLAKDILRYSNIYVGMRDYVEIAECKAQNLFDIIIGVIDPDKELEDSSSFNIDVYKEADIIIINREKEGLERLKEKVLRLKPLFVNNN